MLLEQQDAQEFLEHYKELICAFSDHTPTINEEWLAARDNMLLALDGKVDLPKNPLAISASRSVSGEFCFLKRYKNHCAVRHLESSKFYAVRSLTTPLEDLANDFTIVNLCLVPFKGMIVCDGLISFGGIHLGRGYIQEFRDSYQEAKKNGTIIWDMDSTQQPQLPKKKTKAKKPSITAKQGQYLSFIYYYTKIHRESPAERDIQNYFQVSSPSVHQMILNLEKKGLLRRIAGRARSMELLVGKSDIPELE